MPQFAHTHLKLCQLILQDADEIPTIRSLGRKAVTHILSLYQLKCVAIYANINHKSTLIAQAHHADQLRNLDDIRNSTSLTASHPQAQQHINQFFHHQDGAKKNQTIKFIPTGDDKPITIIPIAPERVLYLEPGLQTTSTWQHTCELLQEQMLILHECIIQRAHLIKNTPLEQPTTEYEYVNDQLNSDTILNQLPFGIFRTDLEGDSRYINPYLLKLMGLEYEQAIDEGWNSSMHPDDMDETISAWMALKNHGTPFKKEIRIQTPDGRVTWIYSQMFPEYDKNGKHIGYLGTSVDISKRREAEEQIRAHQQQLAKLERLHGMGAVVSGLAHELNQPLTVASVYAQECQKYKSALNKSNPEIAKALEKITVNTKKAGDIIHRISDFFQKGNLTIADTRLSVIINSLIRTVSEARFDDAIIQYELKEANRIIQVDALHVEQVLFNLIQNAYQAMSHLPKQDSLIQFFAEVTDVEVVFKVTDSGPGVSKPIAEKIFEPFFSTKPQGLGLGLAICRSIAHAHGGRIELNTQDVHGHEFVLTLPLKSPHSVSQS